MHGLAYLGGEHNSNTETLLHQDWWHLQPSLCQNLLAKLFRISELAKDNTNKDIKSMLSFSKKRKGATTADGEDDNGRGKMLPICTDILAINQRFFLLGSLCSTCTTFMGIESVEICNTLLLVELALNNK